jgi:hypothetical protein
MRYRQTFKQWSFPHYAYSLRTFLKNAIKVLCIQFHFQCRYIFFQFCENQLIQKYNRKLHINTPPHTKLIYFKLTKQELEGDVSLPGGLPVFKTDSSPPPPLYLLHWT